jgi:hypothetical protein
MKEHEIESQKYQNDNRYSHTAYSHLPSDTFNIDNYPKALEINYILSLGMSQPKLNIIRYPEYDFCDPKSITHPRRNLGMKIREPQN